MKPARKANMRKKPLFRKVNTRTHNVRHGDGGDYRHTRNSKAADSQLSHLGKMKSNHRHGFDYTPLFKFLLSKVGNDWDEVHREAVSRLDKEEPIYWIVARHGLAGNAYVRLGESSYFSGLFVDEDNRLALVAPQLNAEIMIPFCSCCTHTFNGIRFGQDYEEDGYQKIEDLIHQVETRNDLN